MNYGTSNAGSVSGSSISGDVSACTSPYIYQPINTLSWVSEPFYPMQIRKVENGYIVKMGGKEYIAKDIDAAAALMKKHEAKAS